MVKTIKIAIIVGIGVFSIFAIWQTVLAMRAIEVSNETDKTIAFLESDLQTKIRDCQDHREGKIPMNVESL